MTCPVMYAVTCLLLHAAGSRAVSTVASGFLAQLAAGVRDGITWIFINSTDFPEWLRSSVRHAGVLAADEQAWQRIRQPVPAWEANWPARLRDTAVRVAANRARDTSRAHFVYRDRQRIVCSVNPPGRGRFFSVTGRGHWSAHQGLTTVPLDRSPLARGFSSPVDLAAADRPRVFAATAVPQATPRPLPAGGTAPRTGRGR